MRVEEMRALKKALADGRADEALVETGEHDQGHGDQPQQALDGQSGEIVSHQICPKWSLSQSHGYNTVQYFL